MSEAGRLNHSRMIPTVFLLIALLLASLGCVKQPDASANDWSKKSCSGLDPETVQKCCEAQNIDRVRVQCVGAWAFEQQRGGCVYECGKSITGEESDDPIEISIS
ncbi:MAG TPA: hypothetical protein VJI75_04120 [Candidatus Nanoarchaeia archaeon]|nr:hypothetical protein [Candidatus Nanoarchaeia archaeon]